MQVNAAIEALGTARDNGIQLTMRSAQLLSKETEEAAHDFVEETKQAKLKRMVSPAHVALGFWPAHLCIIDGSLVCSPASQTVITSMCTLNKSNESIGAVGCLVIGTEAGEVGYAVQQRVCLPVACVTMFGVGAGYGVEPKRLDYRQEGSTA